MWRCIVMMAVAAACGSSRRPKEVPVCKEPPQEVICPWYLCGPNSPIANDFPINGFPDRVDGRCNVFGVQLMPASLTGGGCGKGADLAFDERSMTLVGKRDSKIVCRGPALVNASFQVRSFTSATATFTISEVRSFEHAKTRYEGYRIESDGAPACDASVSRKVQQHLGLRSVAPEDTGPRAAGYTAGENDDLVIAIPGPVYDAKDETIEEHQKGWFNLACVRDSLAKRTLYELFTAGDDERNETALKLLTANYCGRRFTVRGMQIEWQKEQMHGPSEAKWANGKALCLDTPRVAKLQLEEGQELVPTRLPAELQPKACSDGHCTDWNTWTQALRDECHLTACPEQASATFEFASFFHDASAVNQVAVAKAGDRD